MSELTQKQAAMVAHALEADPVLLPYLPTLLADLQALGSDPEWAVELLGELDLGPDTRALDLGCGKGAVAVAVAADLGWQVRGLDLFEPFVVEARALARTQGLAHRCHFEQGDSLAPAGTVPPVDVVLWCAMGDVLGPPAATMGVLRRYVRPGGHILVQDVCLASADAPPFPGMEGLGTAAVVAQGLTSHGDRLLEQDLDESGAEDDDDESARILARAHALAAEHPEHADALLGFARAQAGQVAWSNAHLLDATWMIQRC